MTRIKIPPFGSTLARHGLELKRTECKHLQVNVGLSCNQSCAHCHHEAGPDRQELMSRETMETILDFAAANSFDIIDITGGAPELNPNIRFLVENAATISPRVIFRSNLTVDLNGQADGLFKLCAEHKIVVVGSFPSTNQTQFDGLRGVGYFQKALERLRKLNALGYGVSPRLELDLVLNPAGAFFPPSPAGAEKRFKRELNQKWGIQFNTLFTFANTPMGRFRKWLQETNNYDHYMNKLVKGFNPCVVEGVMCRSLLSVGWDGAFYDCDFNLALKIPCAGLPRTVFDSKRPPEEGSPIAMGNHCYACVAGSGFT